MEKEQIAIFNAISMYIASPTGRGKTGGNDIRIFAQQVAKMLVTLYTLKEIGTESNLAIDGHKVSGYYKKCWLNRMFGRDILIEKTILEDLMGLSNIIVHEGGHAVLVERCYHDLTQELWNTALQTWYFSDQKVGGWKYQHLNENNTKTIQTVHKLSSYHTKWSEGFKGIEERKTDGIGLIDELLVLPNYKDMLDAEWIKAHYRDEGGILKRRDYTISLFIRELAKIRSRENAKTILKILIIIVADNSASATEIRTRLNRIIELAGGPRTISNGTKGLILETEKRSLMPYIYL